MSNLFSKILKKNISNSFISLIILTLLSYSAMGNLRLEVDKNPNAKRVKSIELVVKKKNITPIPIKSSALKKGTFPDVKLKRKIINRRKSSKGYCKNLFEIIGTSICCWRVYDPKKIYRYPAYEAGLLEGSEYCIQDVQEIMLTCRRPLHSQLRHRAKSRVMRDQARFYGHAVCSRTIARSSFILGYVLSSFLINTSDKVNQLIDADVQICENDFLERNVRINFDHNKDSTPSSLDSQESINNGLNLLDSFTYLFDNVEVDFRDVQEIMPSLQALNDLEKELTSVSFLSNDTFYLGYRFYPDFWPNEANQKTIENFYQKNNINSTVNTTTSSTTSTDSEIFKVALTKSVKLCLSFNSKATHSTLSLGARVGSSGRYCGEFTLPDGFSILNVTTTVENIVNYKEIDNNFYETIFESEISLLELRTFTLDVDINSENIEAIAQRRYEENKERVKQSIAIFLDRVRKVSDSYGFLAVAKPILVAGYEVGRIGLGLRIIEAINTISKTPFIIVFVGVSFLVELAPFDFSDILNLIRAPELIFNFVLDIGTGICRFQSKEELFWVYSIGKILKKHDALVNKMREIVSFTKKNAAVEATYKGIKGLAFKDLFKNMSLIAEKYEKELNGQILRGGFPIPMGKVLCNSSRSDSFFNSTNNPDCALWSDFSYATGAYTIANQGYNLSLKLPWVLAIYPFVGAFTVLWIESIAKYFCPLADVSGKMIGTSDMKAIEEGVFINISNLENQEKLRKFRRSTALIPFLISTPFFIIGIRYGILF